MIYYSDYHCSHLIAISGDQWPDDFGCLILEPRFTCQVWGRCSVDVRPDSQSAEVYA